MCLQKCNSSRVNCACKVIIIHAHNLMKLNTVWDDYTIIMDACNHRAGQDAAA